MAPAFVFCFTFLLLCAPLRGVWLCCILLLSSEWLLLLQEVHDANAMVFAAASTCA